ncbi:MAG: restriction endonuclease subunit S [Flavobacteriia bacterium]|nr:restriction endonuclease subunit S [Flavobacteriia bacterium]
MEMKKYDSYKDSGVEWIGEIPNHWGIKRIKHTTYVKGRIGWQGMRSDEFLEESDSYVVTGTDFKNGKVKWDTCYQVPIERYDEDPFIQLQNDDLLITKDGTIGKIAVVKDIPKIATLNSGVFLTRPLYNSYSSEFMYWILFSEVFKSFYDFNKSGSTIQHLYQNVFNEFKFPLPPLEEQTFINNFLDHKTAQIDTLIAKKERFIQLLEEERTAIINQVVTKGLPAEERLKEGLDPTVPMKDSGIEWLGEIPEHWEVKKLKLLANIQGRIGFKGYTVGDLVSEGEGALTLGAKHIDNNNKLNLANPEFISWDKYYESPEIMVKVGDILLTQRGTLGKVVLISEDIGEATINPSMVILSDLKAYDYFLYYFFNSSYFKSWIDFTNTATAVPMISQGQLGNLKLVLPDVNEQKEIVNQILISTKRIDEIISKTHQEIELLKEYKTALISEVVTGKVDVRNEKLN